MAPPAGRRMNHRFGLYVWEPNDKCYGEYGKMMKRKKQDEMNRTMAKSLKLWELPVDLLQEEILSCLHSADRVRLGATCKENHSLITTTSRDGHKNHPIDELPWLATFSSVGRLQLFDPGHRRGRPPYITYEIECAREEGFINPYNTVKASKNGWLLFLWPKKPFLKSLLLFSPFNRRFIKLPDLNDGVVSPRDNWVPCLDSWETVATFSSPDPSSPAECCVYFVLTQNVIPGKISISTLQQERNTTSEWKTLLFDQLNRTIESVTYHDGLFYCLFLSEGGNLAAYDPVQENFTIIISSYPLLYKQPDFVSKDYIVECDGRLLLVCLHLKFFYYFMKEKKKRNKQKKKKKKKKTTNGIKQEKKKKTTNEVEDHCSLFEFNSSTKSWVQKTSLGDHAIFVGQVCHTSFAVSAPWSCDIVNKIYFYRDRNLHRKQASFYSFKDGKSYRCTGRTSSYWSSAIPGGIWIQPPPTESP